MNLETFSFGSAEDLARVAARDFVQAVLRRDGARPFGVALPGGRIAAPFFREIVAESRRRSADWRDVHFFWGDERCVPPEHAESNFLLARKELLGPLGIPGEQVHRILGEAECGFAAEQAQAEIRRIIPLSEVGQPMLDLVLLGMGEDGHTASLFPGEPPEAARTSRVYRCVIGPKPPPRRITLGYFALAAAREVWLLASGEAKAEAYKGLIGKDLRLPIARVARSRERMRVYEDISRKKV